MSERQQMTTAAWISIIVGVVMFSAGIILDVDARRVNQQYAVDHDSLMQVMTKDTARDARIDANTTQIARLLQIAQDQSASIARLQVLVEKHVGL